MRMTRDRQRDLFIHIDEPVRFMGHHDRGASVVTDLRHRTGQIISPFFLNAR